MGFWEALGSNLSWVLAGGMLGLLFGMLTVVLEW